MDWMGRRDTGKYTWTNAKESMHDHSQISPMRSREVQSEFRYDRVSPPDLSWSHIQHPHGLPIPGNVLNSHNRQVIDANHVAGDCLSIIARGSHRRCTRGVGDGLGVAVGVTVSVAVAVGVQVAVIVGVAVSVGVLVGVGVGLGGV